MAKKKAKIDLGALKDNGKRAIPDLKAPAKAGLQPPISVLRGLEPPPEDPLAAVEYEGDLEGDTVKEFDAIQSGYVQRQKRDQERFAMAVDTEFWFAVCFQSRRQKDTFLNAMGWSINGDKYIDGTWLLWQYDIPFEWERLSNKQTRKAEAWRALVPDDSTQTYLAHEYRRLNGVVDQLRAKLHSLGIDPDALLKEE